MRIIVSGASGLVGSALLPGLRAAGHQVGRLVRTGRGAGVAGAGAAAGNGGAPDDIVWDPGASTIDAARLEGVDGVVHLAGENVAAGRWTEARKEEIRRSRVEGTRLLCQALGGLRRPPQTLVSASAIGFYGDRGEEVLKETSARGHGFLPAVCVAWEAQTQPIETRVRVVHARFGIILSARGGALAKMLPPFRAGVGGVLGGGRQHMSWVSLDDAVAAIAHALSNAAVRGPVNVVAPEPVTNFEFTKTLGRVLGRPTVFPVPAFATRLLFGEMADALLLASARVVPEALLGSGFRFRHASLETALRDILGR